MRAQLEIRMNPNTSAPFPELVGQWLAPGTMRRAKGFAAPLQQATLQPGASLREAYTTRQAEMAESRSSFGLIREEVFLNQTPDCRATSVARSRASKQPPSTRR